MDNLFLYVISLSITTLVYVYILHLPEKISGAKSLVKHYYYDNGIKNFIFDVFLVYIYISIARFFMRLLKNHPILSTVNNLLIDLPAPSNISYF